MSNNVKAYKEIFEEWKRNPNHNQSKACKDKGVSYGGYMSWRREQMKPGSVNADNAGYISIMISVAEVVSLIQHKKDLCIPREKLLTTLSPDQKQIVAAALGMALLSHKDKDEEHGLNDQTMS